MRLPKLIITDIDQRIVETAYSNISRAVGGISVTPLVGSLAEPLAQIAGAFGDQGVSLASVWQEGRGTGATLLLVTHEAPESSLRAARQAVEALDAVVRVAARIRVHDPE